MRRSVPALALGFLVSALCALAASAAGPNQATDWRSANYDDTANRYSPLDQITPQNVATLQQAWSFHMKPADFTGALREDEAIPIVIGNTMYLSTPYGAIHALDATTGTEKWTFRLPNNDRPAKRGIAYWPGGDGVPPSLVFGGLAGGLYSIKASDGTLNTGFGENGIVNLKTPEVMQTGMNANYSLLSPPTIYKNLIIIGAGTGEGAGGSNAGTGPAGDTRAWDARTGKLVWTFHTVPRPGRARLRHVARGQRGEALGCERVGLHVARRGARHPLHAAWRTEQRSRRHRSAWQQPVLIVGGRGRREHRPLPLALPGRPSRHLGLRHPIGAAARGPRSRRPDRARRHHRHQDGPAVHAQPCHGQADLPIEERPVPKSDLPREAASPTQPFPVKPEPLVQMTVSRNNLYKGEPQHQSYCEHLVDDNDMKLGGPYMPIAVNRYSISPPGPAGGINFWGASYDPKLRLFISNTTNMFQPMRLILRADGSWVNSGPLAGLRRFGDPDCKLLCGPTPWGELVAVDMDSGDIRYRKTLGVSDMLPPGLQDTGRPSSGGVILTASGLTFVGGTDDFRFRAFATATGEKLWEIKMPSSIETTPITYMGADGRQFVTVVSTGGGLTGSAVTNDEIIAFALPKK